ncbi:probable peptidyl-tRNA hydrolase [Montipora capricornis]|uniref:probable peptidyl-tRNA hydrolase n=1 Tax=Montipora capricornis TaxID=246305 RepID=UPI0035F16D60
MVENLGCTFWKVLNPDPSKSLRFICRRKLNQAQANDARKLRTMIVGLGNYILRDTRHSVGMLLVDHLGKQLGTAWQLNQRSRSLLAVTKLNGQQLILLKPMVAMNINGKSIVKAVTMFNVEPSNIILAHDDLDRPLGKFSIKHGGSAGGHNGVKSAISSLKSDVMKRVRIGIGRPDNKHDVTEYVLSKFDSSEIPVMRDTVVRCCEVLINEVNSIMDQTSTRQKTKPRDTETDHLQVQ